MAENKCPKCANRVASAAKECSACGSTILLVDPQLIAEVIVHFGNQTLAGLAKRLRTLATRPDGWRLVHEDLLLLMYCLIMSRLSSRLPQPVRDPLWEEVAVHLANYRAKPARLVDRLLTTLRRSSLSLADPAATKCFADAARIRAAIEDYLQYVDERSERAKRSHPMMALRFVRGFSVTVFEAHLLKYLGIEPKIDREVLYALMESAAAITGILPGVDWWVLADEPPIGAQKQGSAGFGDTTDQSRLATRGTGATLSRTNTEATAWRQAAEAGDAEAQFSLAVAYAFGFEGPSDPARAADWFRKAAEQGHADSQFNLGQDYAAGHGVPQDATLAVAWLRKAADQGHAGAQADLGMLYSKGQGVFRDSGQAAAWQRLSAEQGDCRGQFNLGLAYYRGEGVPQDYVKAHSWMNLAAARAPTAFIEDRHQRDHYAEIRDEIAAKLTPQQLVEAQVLAREWTAVFEEQNLDERGYENDE